MSRVRPDVKPLHVFPAPKGKTGGKPLRVFPAEEWEQWGGEPGLYRVMIGEAWFSVGGARASFFDPAGLGEVIQRWGLQSIGLAVTPDPLAVHPDAPQNTRVWCCDNQGDSDLATITRTLPFQDGEGFWRVWVFGRKWAVLLADLQLREVAK